MPVEGQPVRGRLVRLGPLVDDILGRHAYPKPVAGLLGELLTLSALLGDALKFDGIFSLQTKGEGPVKLMVADKTSAGDLRAYAQFDERLERMLRPTARSLPRLTGPGYLAFTVDQGPDTDRYQGIVELNGETLVDCIHHYFRQSEQIRTAIVFADGRDAGRQAPDQRHHAAAHARAGRCHARTGRRGRRRTVASRCLLLSTVTRQELNDRSLAPNDLLFRLFHEEGVRVFDQRTLQARCRCSRERVERTLAQLPHDDLVELIEDDRLTVTCEFCNRSYGFNEQDTGGTAARRHLI